MAKNKDQVKISSFLSVRARVVAELVEPQFWSHGELHLTQIYIHLIGLRDRNHELSEKNGTWEM